MRLGYDRDDQGATIGDFVMVQETNSKVLKFFAAAITALAASCAAVGDGGEGEEITVSYDPAHEGVADALSQAQAHCAAFGATAVFVDETIDPDGRLRHRRFRCR